MTVTFSVYSVLRLCNIQTEACIHCRFGQPMTTCFENLVKHFHLVILELEQLKLQDGVPEEQEDKIWELLSKTIP